MIFGCYVRWTHYILVYQHHIFLVVVQNDFVMQSSQTPLHSPVLKNLETLDKLFYTILLLISNPTTSLICLFMSISSMSTLVVTITLAPTFISKHFVRPPVLDCFRIFAISRNLITCI